LQLEQAYIFGSIFSTVLGFGISFLTYFYFFFFGSGFLATYFDGYFGMLT